MADEYEPSQEELDAEWAHAAVGLSRNAAAYDNLKRIHAASVAAAKAERERCQSACQAVAARFGERGEFRTDLTIGREDGAIMCDDTIRALPVEGGK